MGDVGRGQQISWPAPPVSRTDPDIAEPVGPLCVLVMVGVRTDGTKELVAIADGYRESTESWAELLRDCRRRGMRAPVLAVGDGALRFWGAIRDVFPETRWQRDWVHKVANILNALPASVQAAAKRALREIWDGEDRSHDEWPPVAASLEDVAPIHPLLAGPVRVGGQTKPKRNRVTWGLRPRGRRRGRT